MVNINDGASETTAHVIHLFWCLGVNLHFQKCVFTKECVSETTELYEKFNIGECVNETAEPYEKFNIGECINETTEPSNFAR